MSIASTFQNLSVRAKVIGAFAVVLIATVALGAFAIERLSDVDSHAENIRNNWLPSVQHLGELNYDATRIRQKQASYLLEPTEEGRARQAADVKTLEADADRAIQIYEPFIGPGRERDLASKFEAAWQTFVSQQDQLIDLYRTKGQAAAFAYFNGPYKNSFETFHTALEADLAFNANGGRSEADDGAASYASARIWIMAALAMAAALSAVAGFALISAVSAPLVQMTGVMGKLATGDLSVDVPASNRRDEIGQLASAMKAFKDQLAAAERSKTEQTETIVGSVGAGLSALAKGDLVHRVSADLTGPFAKLKDDFNGALSHLQETMQTVLNSTSGISTGAGEISQAADDLSKRTEQQAASLEETAAALEEITATVKKTAQNAKEASIIVTTAKSAAEDGGRVVETAIQAMGQIAQSSKQITDIIGVIDEIAFQTNLLALNAGVEAARAGDAGKGFAVVASEVRALAQRSSEAAREIKTLIKTSGEQVDSGVKLVGESGQALKRIVDRVVEINALVTEMAQAAQQQSTGIEEVNVAVSQMDQVTQQNAAMVEQSTAASRNLASETTELANLVSFFNVGAERAPAASRTAGPSAPSAGKAVARAVPRTTASPRAASGGRRAATALAARPVAQNDEWEEF